MNRDQFNGASRHLKGRVQTAIGGLTGDPVRQVRGAANQVTGGAQYAYGRARDRAEDLVDDGRHLAHEARERAEGFAQGARERPGISPTPPARCIAAARPMASAPCVTPTGTAPTPSSASPSSPSRRAGSSADRADTHHPRRETTPCCARSSRSSSCRS